MLPDQSTSEAVVIAFAPRGRDDDRVICQTPRPRRSSCRHSHLEVDASIRKVFCVDCEEEVDPIDALNTLAYECDRYVHSRDRLEREAKQASVTLEDLKRQVRNAKAQLRRSDAS